MTLRKLEPKGQWEARWECPSDSDPELTYVIAMSQHGEWACGCRGWTMHVPRKDCKHIRRVKQVEPVDTSRQIAPRKQPQPVPKIVPRALTMNQVRDLEKQLVGVDGGPKRMAKPAIEKPEPFFVRQTRRAITLED
jgi:hypothetical protein